MSLESSDREAIGEEFARNLLADDEIHVHRDLQNDLHWEINLDESAVVSYLLDTESFGSDVQSALRKADSIEAVSESDRQALSAMRETLGGDPLSVIEADIGQTVLEARLPEFRLVGETSILDGQIDIDALSQRREAGDLDDGDRAFLSLLSIAGIDPESFREVDESREKVTELETASATISEEAMSYWSQSGDVQIRIRESADEENTLELTVENQKHNVTVGFDQRSRGFRWFFSSFCQLSELQEDERVILMLDEPGLNLHARAKQEFLEFMKEEVTVRQPIIYTTHSPFMIDSENLHRTKMVMADPIGETNLFTDVALADKPTQFPLRNVFEFDLMDTLLVKPQTLLVEEKADHAYLYVLSKILEDHDQDGLDSRWTVVPIKDNRNISSFIALFGGEQLDVAALLNEDPSARRRPRSRTDREQSVEEEIPTKLSSDYSDSGDGTLEDIFSESFYLLLVNRTYSTAIKEAERAPEQLTSEDLDGGTDVPIVERLEGYFETHGINGGEFDRSEPALYLQEHRGELGAEIDTQSRRSFGRLFRDLNNTLDTFESVDSREGSILEILGLA